jgi:hypothetical protein
MRSAHAATAAKPAASTAAIKEPTMSTKKNANRAARAAGVLTRAEKRAAKRKPSPSAQRARAASKAQKAKAKKPKTPKEPKAAKPSKPAEVKTEAGPNTPRPGSKLELIASLLNRPEGTTTAEVLKACEWPSVSMPQQAKALGISLLKKKIDGVNRYFNAANVRAEEPAEAAAA